MQHVKDVLRSVWRMWPIRNRSAFALARLLIRVSVHMYRPSHLAVAIVALSALALAGCGGGSHSSALPSGGTSLSPQLNGGPGNSALPTLYVSGQGGVFAYDLNASGDTAPVQKDSG